MRVLHIGKYLPPAVGGMEHFLADVLGASKSYGITAAALVHSETTKPAGLRPGPPDPVAIYSVPCLGRILYAPFSPTFPRWLNRAIQELAPDLLHIHLPNTSAFAALAIGRARRLPWVLHWHADVGSSRIDRRLALAYHLYRPFEQWLLARSSVVIATSPPYLESSAALRPWRHRCTAIPLGIDPSRLTTPTTDRVTAGSNWRGDYAPRILSIGRLTYYKGHDVLIRAIARVPSAQLLIVGDGERRSSLENLRRELSLQDRVALLGSRPQDELAALLASCDIVCLPSLERSEAFGLVLLEAMHFSKPVVATDIPGSGTGWLVHRAGHGLLVPPHDVDALAAALSELGADGGLRHRLGSNGRAALEGQFSIDTVLGALSDVYTRVLSARPTDR